MKSVFCRYFGPKQVLQLDMVLFQNIYTETSLFCDKKDEFLYTAQMLLSLYNLKLNYVWTQPTEYLYEIQSYSSQLLFITSLYQQKKVATCDVFILKNQAKCFQITQKNYSFSYTKDSVNKQLLTLSFLPREIQVLENKST